ncbi:unnamed protein product [Brassica oleracea var. botrytis]
MKPSPYCSASSYFFDGLITNFDCIKLYEIYIQKEIVRKEYLLVVLCSILCL